MAIADLRMRASMMMRVLPHNNAFHGGGIVGIRLVLTSEAAI